MIESQNDVWLRFIEGDQKAFEQIYRNEVSFLLSYGMSIINDSQGVEDSIQELFVDLWSRRHNLSKEVTIRSYLLVSLKRRLLKNKKTLIPLEEQIMVESQQDIQAKIMIAETEISNSQTLQKAMKDLSPQQREAINLRFFQDKSYDEMKEILGINYQSCRNVVSMAIRQLGHIKDKLIV